MSAWSGGPCPLHKVFAERAVGKLHRFCGNEKAPVVAGNGFLMSGTTSNAGYITGINEIDFMRALTLHLKQKSVIINVGANAGYLSLYISKYLSGNCRVFAFEPDPGTFSILQQNVALNDFNIRAEQVAVGDTDGTLAFASFEPGDGHAHVIENGDNAHAVEVKSIRLDSYSAPAPDWIIMDVEGFGANVVAGAIETIRSSHCTIAAEIHSKKELEGIEYQLIELGYSRLIETRGRGGHHIIWRHPSRANA